MQLLLAIISILASGILVVLVPGACMLANWRLDRVVPPPLVPAAALTLGLIPLAAALAVTLLLHLPIAFVTGFLAIFVLTGWGRLAARARRDRHDDRFTRARARTTPRDWMTPVRDLVAGSWLRATPTAALVLAAAGGVLALVVGFYAWNDSLYHIAQAQKLLVLDAPTFSNTLQFVDGSAHPGYLLPTWHEAMALTAFVSRQDLVTVAWVLPALTFPIMLLSIGGLAWSLARSHVATPVAVAAMLLLNIAGLPYSDAITNAMQPGVLALGVLAPLVLAMLMTALWPTTQDAVRGVSSDAPSQRVTTRAAVFIAIVATAGLGMLHVAYLIVLGMGVLAYYLLWALRSPWPREVVRRHLLVGMSIALMAGIVLGALYPGLTNLDGLGRDAATELAATDNVQYEGENGANLDLLLRGDPDGAFHLRGDYLIQAGGLALVGLLGLLVPLAAPRWPGGWYLSGAAALVLTIALSDRVFPGFVALVTLDQARRIERVLPTALGLAAFVLAVGAGATRIWRSGGTPMRVAAIGWGAGAACMVAGIVGMVAPLAGYGGERIVHPRVLVAILVVLLIGVAAPLVRRLPFASWTWPTELLDARVGMVALGVLLVGAAPVYDQLQTVRDTSRLAGVPLNMRGAELRLFSARVADQLRELPVGATVLADPRGRNPYTAMAIAPVYVVSSVPRHTARTPKNRVDERFDLAVSFFDDGMSAPERTTFLRTNKIDAVLVHPATSREMRDQLEHMSGVRMVATGKNQRLYLIDRTKLPPAS